MTMLTTFRTRLFGLVMMTVLGLGLSCRSDKERQPAPAPPAPAAPAALPVSQPSPPAAVQPAEADLDLDLPPMPPRLDRTGPAAFTVMYTTSVSGELLDCGCPKHPRGGLAKRALLVEEKKKAAALVQFDAGNALFPFQQGTGEVQPAALEKAEVIARTMGKLKVDVFNVGVQDLNAGLEFLRQQAAAHDLPLVSANLLDPGTGELLFPAFKVIEIEGARIGVFGLIETRQVRDPAFQTADPRVVVPLLINHLRPSCDMIVLLYAGGYVAASQIAKDAPGIDLIIAADRAGSPSTRPLVVGDSIVTQGGNRGMYVGSIDFTLLMEAKTLVSEQEKDVIKKRLELLEAQEAITAGQVQRDPEVKALHDKTAAEIEEIRGRIGNAVSRLEYQSAVISVDPELPDDPEVAEWVKAAQ